MNGDFIVRDIVPRFVTRFYTVVPSLPETTRTTPSPGCCRLLPVVHRRGRPTLSLSPRRGAVL
jgi:hypothetical protein